MSAGLYFLHNSQLSYIRQVSACFVWPEHCRPANCFINSSIILVSNEEFFFSSSEFRVTKASFE